METASENVALQYGVLGVVCLAFAYVIIALFKRGERRDDKAAEDRATWAAKEATLRAEQEQKLSALRTEFEAKHSAALVEYAKQLHGLRVENQQREDMSRAEYSVLMEKVSEEAVKANAATTEVLHKVYERFLGPRGVRP